mgnify:FL=1
MNVWRGADPTNPTTFEAWIVSDNALTYAEWYEQLPSPPPRYVGSFWSEGEQDYADRVGLHPEDIKRIVSQRTYRAVMQDWRETP